MSSEIVVNYIEHLKNNKPEPIHVFHGMIDNDKKLIQELEESPFIARGMWGEAYNNDDKNLKDWGFIKSLYYIHKDYFLKNADRCKISKDILHKWINFKPQKTIKK
jgi:hypothetical protein